MSQETDYFHARIDRLETVIENLFKHLGMALPAAPVPPSTPDLAPVVPVPVDKQWDAPWPDPALDPPDVPVAAIAPAAAITPDEGGAD